MAENGTDRIIHNGCLECYGAGRDTCSHVPRENWTKGPWRIGNLESYDAYTGLPYRNVWAGIDDGAHCIARAIEEDCRQLSDVDANAHLISAAPDLYEALKNCVDAMALRQESNQQSYDEAVIAAAAALAKARGETDA